MNDTFIWRQCCCEGGMFWYLLCLLICSKRKNLHTWHLYCLRFEKQEYLRSQAAVQHNLQIRCQQRASRTAKHWCYIRITTPSKSAHIHTKHSATSFTFCILTLLILLSIVKKKVTVLLWNNAQTRSCASYRLQFRTQGIEGDSYLSKFSCCCIAGVVGQE